MKANKGGIIDERYAVLIMREVLVALSFLHRANIIHRDLKGVPRVEDLENAILKSLISCERPPYCHGTNSSLRFWRLCASGLQPLEAHHVCWDALLDGPGGHKTITVRHEGGYMEPGYHAI
jgi:serine/threonine protein kinase